MDRDGGEGEEEETRIGENMGVVGEVEEEEAWDEREEVVEFIEKVNEGVRSKDDEDHTVVSMGGD